MIVNSSKFCILVNTTDSFEDCWMPFFKLFTTFWPNFDGNIYLNTEKKSFEFSGLNIISIQNGMIGSPWAKCLEQAIHAIEEDTILYMQEDYFLRECVNHKHILELYLIFKNNMMDCLHLTDQCTSGPI